MTWLVITGIMGLLLGAALYFSYQYGRSSMRREYAEKMAKELEEYAKIDSEPVPDRLSDILERMRNGE